MAPSCWNARNPVCRVNMVKSAPETAPLAPDHAMDHVRDCPTTRSWKHGDPERSLSRWHRARGHLRRTNLLHGGIGCHARHQAFAPELFRRRSRKSPMPGCLPASISFGYRRWSTARGVSRPLRPCARCAAGQPISRSRHVRAEFRASICGGRSRLTEEWTLICSGASNVPRGRRANTALFTDSKIDPR